MSIDIKAINSVILKLNNNTLGEGALGLRYLHVRDLKEALKSEIEMYSIGVKNPGQIEESILNIAHKYLVEVLDWADEWRFEGEPGYFISG